MIVEVIKESIGYTKGQIIDLDDLAKRDYEKYVHVIRKMQEKSIVEKKAVVSIPETKQVKEIQSIEMK
jgi:hypothetical protein